MVGIYRSLGLSLSLCLFACGDDGGGGGGTEGEDTGTGTETSTSTSTTTTSTSTTDTSTSTTTDTSTTSMDTGSTTEMTGDTGDTGTGTGDTGTGTGTGTTTGNMGDNPYPPCEQDACPEMDQECFDYGNQGNLCTYMGCQSDDDCPPTTSGDATAMCAENVELCVIDCSNDATCPDGMECIQFMGLNRCVYAP